MIAVAIIGGVIFYGVKRLKPVQNEEKPELLTEEQIDSLEFATKEPTILFGEVVDSMMVIEEKVRRNQNLSEILIPYNVSFATIDRLARNSKKVFDVRKIQAGKKYTLICYPDSLQTAKTFIYQPNPIEYYVFNLQDSLKVYKGEKEVEIIKKDITGVITSSLYVAMMEAGASPALAAELSDVFAWQIDFFRIQKNDKFKVIYEEKQVEGEEVGIGKILGAYFQHFGEDYYGIYYDQGDGLDYFDEKGNSLRKAFLKAPLKYSRISSRFSRRRFHPVQKRYKAHLGTDYAAPTGTPILAVGDGVIQSATYSRYNGNYVKIRHNSTYSTQYLHMSKIARGMRAGRKVRQGDVIGYVGSTGLATGPHLCYRFWKNGKQVDALRVKIPPSEPIQEKNKIAYFEIRDEIMNELDNIKLGAPMIRGELASKKNFSNFVSDEENIVQFSSSLERIKPLGK
nr:peptidoglycan DD-metalloendopeptidase family protein [Xanthovirga aplysinae]